MPVFVNTNTWGKFDGSLFYFVLLAIIFIDSCYHFGQKQLFQSFYCFEFDWLSSFFHIYDVLIHLSEPFAKS